MPISQQLGCVFVHIPRTGGTSVETALDMRRSWQIEDREVLFGLIRSPAMQAIAPRQSFLQHLTAAQIDELLRPEQRRFFRFSFVRNPWDRMVSIYHRLDPHMRQTAEAAGIHLHGVSFREFVARVDGFDHVHLQPQSDFVFDNRDRLQVDVLGRYETLSVDFDAICRQLGTALSLPHVFKSDRATYLDYYDTDTARAVAVRYARDIDLLKYRM